MQTYRRLVFAAIVALSALGYARESPAPPAPIPGSSGNMQVGTTGGDQTDANWVCTLANATSLTVDRFAKQTPPSGYLFPFGFLRYRIDDCGYTGSMLTVPPPGFRAIQFLVIELPAAPPAQSTFMNFGPTRDDAIPHWYTLPARIDGATLRIMLGDGDPGDDDLVIDNVIAGIGGVAVPIDIASVPTLSQPASTVMALLVLIAFLGALAVRRTDRFSYADF
jgi:hypothetical protein